VSFNAELPEDPELLAAPEPSDQLRAALMRFAESCLTAGCPVTIRANASIAPDYLGIDNS
jgi:hypothetical protein